MKNGILLVLLLFCSLACSRKAAVSPDRRDYARATYEIENSSYSYRTVAANTSRERILVNESSSFLEPKHTTAGRTRKTMKKNILAYRELRDTSVNDEENYQRKNRVKNRKANLALIFGLAALIPAPTAYLFGVLALVFGIISLSEMDKEPLKYKGKGKAIFGVSVGGLLILLLLLVVVYVLATI